MFQITILDIGYARERRRPSTIIDVVFIHAMEPQINRRWANDWAVRHLITDVANGVTLEYIFLNSD